MSAKTAKLQIDGIDKVIELPIYEGTTGPDVLDVRGLVSEGVFTYDPGFVSTASCESEITFIDGGKGVLLGGVPGVLPGKVVVLGGGTVDRDCRVAYDGVDATDGASQVTCVDGAACDIDGAAELVISELIHRLRTG